MRKLIVSLLVLLSGMRFDAIAEGLWGAKATLDLNIPGKIHAGDLSFKNYSSGLGFYVGGVYTHYWGENLFLEPSLSVYYDTYSYSDLVIGEGMVADKDPTIYKVGLRLPVVVGYTFDITDEFAFSVFTGPELNYAFAGGHRFKNKSLKDELDWPLFGAEGDQRRFSVAWKAGLAFPFSDWRVDLEAAIGISDLLKQSLSMRENRISVSLLRYF